MAADTSYSPGFQRRQDGNAAVSSGYSLDIESGANLKLAGTTVTATADEINANASVTAGTVAASKALVVDANKDLGTLRHLAISGNFTSGGTVLSEADLAQVDGITAGAASANKALVAGSDLAVTGQRWKISPKSANYTVTAADSYTYFIATAADVVFTLPATAAGLTYRFSLANAGLSGGTGLSVSPAAADQIAGNGFTLADNKDAINTGATDRAGDFLEIVGDGADGWYITGVIGIWAREA